MTRFLLFLGINAHELISFQQGSLLDSKVQKIGFRDAKVIQEKLVDQDGLTFLFEINGIRIFCGGM
jgi:beta-mannosidase